MFTLTDDQWALLKHLKRLDTACEVGHLGDEVFPEMTGDYYNSQRASMESKRTRHAQNCLRILLKHDLVRRVSRGVVEITDTGREYEVD